MNIIEALKKLSGDLRSWVALNLREKVNKELKSGSTEEYKVLSDNNFTDADKNKLDSAITEHQDISGKQDKLIGIGTGQNIKTINGQNLLGSGNIVITSEAGGITSESDPIFSASAAATITSANITTWTNKYSKPSGGIPKTDLATAVQTSLGKADTALQSYTEQYKGTVTGVKINGTTKNPSSGVVDLGSDYATQTWVTNQNYKTTDNNYYPTAFSWTNGTTSGPIGSLTGSGMGDVSFPAIPSAGATKSGIVTTGVQTFEGNKTFNGEVTGNSGFFDTSDERLKNFQNDVEVDFEKLSKLPKKYFTWKDGKGNLQIGTSAQAVREIYPELVHEDENGKLSVSYNKLSIIALSAIDALYKKNQELENRLFKIEEMLKYGE